MDTLKLGTILSQVSMTLNTVTILPHNTEVHIGMVGKSLALERDIGKGIIIES